MIRLVYCFHIYYHVRRILKKLQVPLPHETGFNAADNPYTKSEFLKICEDYRIPNDPMKYQDEKFCWTYQRGVHCPDDYIGPDSMTRWIIEKLVSFTDVGLLRISESVRDYAYLILSSQASTSGTQKISCDLRYSLCPYESITIFVYRCYTKNLMRLYTYSSCRNRFLSTLVLFHSATCS